MAEKNDKKTMMILLAVLGVVLIGSGIWTYNTLQPLDLGEEASGVGDVQIEYVFKVKEEALDNIEDFLDLEFARGTIWEDFYSDQQFKNLKRTDIEIDVDKNLGNNHPFVTPTSTEEEIEGF